MELHRELEKDIDGARAKVADQSPCCLHCEGPISENELVVLDDKHFCCHGCMSVYSLLRSNNLQEFYHYQDIADSKKSLKNNEKVSTSKFDYMDSDAFKDEFVIKNSDNEVRVDFLLEGIHCLACIWLIERISKIESFVTSAQVNIGNNLASFKIDTSKDYSIAKLAKTLVTLGYIPHPYNNKSDKIKAISNRRDLLQIGIAASAMSNIMIYAVSNYAGATSEYAHLFDGISFALSLPVIFYSARPIFKSSLGAIRLKQTSVDIPLALAISFGFIISSINFFTKSGHVYFDSLTTLVFLILLSRYFVKMLTQKAMSTKGISSLFFNTGVKRFKEGKQEQVYSSAIKLDDEVIFDEDERIIFDGILLSESALILNTINTGESKPIVVYKGDHIEAGAISITNNLRLRVNAIGGHTKLGMNLDSIESNSIAKNPANLWAQKISKYFTYTILILCALVIGYASIIQMPMEAAINTVLAILIVGCPCAFAMATPIVVATRINKLKSQGIFVKNEASLEEIGNIKNIIFDKTGTLTKGKFEVSGFQNISNLNDKEILAITVGLERAVRHPIAFALKKFAKSKLESCDYNKHIISNAKVITGQGVKALINNKQYFIGSHKEQIGLFDITTEKTLLATFKIEDSIRDEVIDLVNFLKKKNIAIHLSTGDHSDIAFEVAEQLGLDKDKIYTNQTPEDKLSLAQDLSNVAFIGDGDNDALAMIKANVSIAIGAQADIAMRSSDIYLANDDINQIKTLFNVASNVSYTLRRNIMFAISYNLVGMILALMQFITPLFAAVLMPLSSLTVVLSSTIGLISLDRLINNTKGKS